MDRVALGDLVDDRWELGTEELVMINEAKPENHQMSRKL